jgi:hypothetical protein
MMEKSLSHAYPQKFNEGGGVGGGGGEQLSDAQLRLLQQAEQYAQQTGQMPQALADEVNRYQGQMENQYDFGQFDENQVEYARGLMNYMGSPYTDRNLYEVLDNQFGSGNTVSRDTQNILMPGGGGPSVLDALADDAYGQYNPDKQYGAPPPAPAPDPVIIPGRSTPVIADDGNNLMSRIGDEAGSLFETAPAPVVTPPPVVTPDFGAGETLQRTVDTTGGFNVGNVSMGQPTTTPYQPVTYSNTDVFSRPVPQNFRDMTGIGDSAGQSGYQDFLANNEQNTVTETSTYTPTLFQGVGSVFQRPGGG